MQKIRKLYDWVLHWAHTPQGPMALFMLSFAEASFFPVPPDVLLIALALGLRKSALKFALICSFASILGAAAGYVIGKLLWWNNQQEFSGFALFFFDLVPGFSKQLFYSIKAQYDTWNFWVIFTAGFTPIPFKVFTISAGAFNINFPMFLIASAISRTARFLLVGGLIWKYGAAIEGFIDRYFNLLAILFSVALVGGFIILKYLF